MLFRLSSLLLLVAAAGCVGSAAPPQPWIEDRLPWHDDGVWLHGDLHIHTLVDEQDIAPRLVAAAVAQGLDFVALSDHAQVAFEGNLGERVRALRRQFPEVLVLAGIEWNVPAAHHATVVVESGDAEAEMLMRFADRFDRKVTTRVRESEGKDPSTWGSLDDAVRALAWLREQHAAGAPLSAVYLNHPSRHPFPTHDQIAQLRAAGLHGVEAAPGHQKRRRPGGVPGSIDRYDPYAAVIDGGYDRLLADGQTLGISAGSDFHHEHDAFYPGEFARSLVFCPERSAHGVVAGLRAGSTGTIVGGLVDGVDTHTGAAGLVDAARIGETLVVPRGTVVTYTITLDVPLYHAWGSLNRIDEVEVIGNYAGQPRQVKRFVGLDTGSIVELRFELPPEATATAGTFFLRARGRRLVGRAGNDRKNADLLFYTAATRVRVVG